MACAVVYLGQVISIWMHASPCNSKAMHTIARYHHSKPLIRKGFASYVVQIKHYAPKIDIDKMPAADDNTLHAAPNSFPGTGVSTMGIHRQTIVAEKDSLSQGKTHSVGMKPCARALSKTTSKSNGDRKR